MTFVRTARVMAAATTVAALAGCAGVPDSGAVHLGLPVAAADGGLVGGTVHEVPAGPLLDASPVQLVSGFLQAMVDSDNGYGVARSYLAPGASWSGATGVTVYENPPSIKRVDADHVLVQAHRVGLIGPNGSYRLAPGTLTRSFTMTRHPGEWRIAGLASGALLSTDDAERVLQPASIYFLTPDGKRVVPEPLLLPPEEPGLATTLIHDLLAGPDPLLGPGVRTAAPRGTQLVGNVPISANGVAEVDLSAGARQIAPARLTMLSAQVVWTLRQIGSITAVRLLANGAPLTASGAASTQPVRSWPQFDPSVPPTTTGALLVRGRAVSGFDAVVPDALRARGLLDPARSADGGVVAALRRTPTGDQLVMGRASGPLRVRLEAGVLSAPTFTPAGRVLVAAGPGRIFSVGVRGPVQQVVMPATLRTAAIQDLAVSRDGTRLALVIGGATGTLRVATLGQTSGGTSIEGSRLVLPSASAVAGVAWSSADQLVATVVEHGARHVVEVSVDGYTVVDLSGPGLPPDVDEVAAAPGQPVLASSSTGTWRLGGHRWQRVSSGVSPSYAG